MLLDLTTALSALDVGNLVNKAHPLAKDLIAWWMVIPQWRHGGIWRNLVGPEHVTMNGLTASPTETSGWGLTTRKGGFGEIRLDGVDNRGVYPDTPKFSFVSGGVDIPFSVTFCAWFSVITASDGIVTKWHAPNTTMEWVVHLQSTRLYWELYHPTNNAIRIGRYATMTTGTYQAQWLSIACTYDGSATSAGLKIYRNGQQVDTVSSTLGSYTGMSDTTAELSIGTYNGIANWLTGKIDDVRLYKRMLSAAEVVELYQNQAQGYPRLLNRLPLWPIPVPLVVVPGLALTGVGL